MSGGGYFSTRETLDGKKWLVRIGWWVLNAFGLYVLTKLFGHVEALVWGFVVQTLPPQETMLYGFVGIGVILATILLFVHNIRTLLRLWFSKGFNAEVVGSKTLRPGEFIRFKASFNGSLNSGFFTARIEAPEDLPDLVKREDKRKTWWPCYDSMIRERNPNTGEYVDKAGRLKGIGLHEHQWPWKIPPDYPTGQYKACICLYEWPDRWITEVVVPFIVTRS